MSKVYISSTYQDLIEQRQAVYHALREIGHDVIAMEDYVAADARPVSKCLRDVADADIYVGIFAWRYGFVPDEGSPTGLSVTELEYRQAQRSEVPRLIFLLRENMPWPPTLMDSQTGDNGSGDRITRLRRELSSDRLCSDFGSSEELARKVGAAVQVCLATDQADPPLAPDPALSRHRFMAHMRRYAGAMSDRQADARYIEIALQQESHDEKGYSQTIVGPLRDLLTHPRNFLVIGPTGSGKTTLLLREAQRSAEDKARHRIYVSLAGFLGGDADTVLELAAGQNRLNSRRLVRSWLQPGNPVRLLVDDVEEPAVLSSATAALGELNQIKAQENTIVAAATNQVVADALTEALHAQRLTVLPLDLDTAIALLNGYGRDDLSSAIRSWSGSGTPLLNIVGHPDLLSAWAQAPRGPSVERPSLGQVLETQLRGLLSEVGQKFDSGRVLAPALGMLAYRMASSSQNSLELNDDLLGELGDLLQGIYQRYYRRRNIMPPDWSAEMLLREMSQSPIVDLDQRDDGTQHVTFGRSRFADWYAAWHVGELGRVEADAMSATTALTHAGAEGALAQLVDADHAGTKYVDAIAVIDLQMAERVWLAGKSGRRAPSSLQKEFDRIASELTEQWIRRDRNGRLSSTANAPDPQHRIQSIGSMTPLEVLLDLASDPHPLVRGSAEYLLLHSAEGEVKLPLNCDKDTLSFHSDGAGQATVSGLRLLSVPPGWVVRLRVVVEHLEADPFKSPDNTLRFLPRPAAAWAADLLSGSGGQGWLKSAATAYTAARFSHNHAILAVQRGQLDDLAERLSNRALDQAALAAVIGEDLGLSMPDLPAVTTMATDAAGDAYARLRYSFDPHISEMSTKVPFSNLDVRTTFDEVAGSAVVVKTTDLAVNSRYTDGYYIADLAKIDVRAVADQVKGGSFQGIAIETMHGSTAPLPIRLQISTRLVAGVVENGSVEGVTVHRIAGSSPNSEVDCRIVVHRLLGDSSLVGIIVGEDA